MWLFMMIKKVEPSADIVALWNEAFGDSPDEIMFFINNLKNGYCLGCYEGGRLVSMLYLVSCCCEGRRAQYVYAACTLKQYRGMGYMKVLLDYCKSECKNGFCLIPADKGLAEYYCLNGINKQICINSISFDESDEICNYLFDGCELEAPFGLMFIKGE